MTKTMIRLSVIVALIVLCASRPVTAQNVGDRVRATTAADTVVGVVSETNERELILVLNDGGFREFAHVEIQRLERHVGDRDSKWEGMGIGLLAGWLVWNLTAEEERVRKERSAADLWECVVTLLIECPDPGYKTERVPTTEGAIALLAGPAIGFFWGLWNKKAQWETVPRTAGSPQSEGRFRRNPNRPRPNPMVGVRQVPGGDAGVVLGIRVLF